MKKVKDEAFDLEVFTVLIHDDQDMLMSQSICILMLLTHHDTKSNHSPSTLWSGALSRPMTLFKYWTSLLLLMDMVVFKAERSSPLSAEQSVTGGGGLAEGDLRETHQWVSQPTTLRPAVVNVLAQSPSVRISAEWIDFLFQCNSRHPVLQLSDPKRTHSIPWPRTNFEPRAEF